MDTVKKPRSEAQKAADKRYYEKTDKKRRKYLTFHVTAEEREEIEKVLAAHGKTALEVFRAAIAELKKDSQ